MKKSSLNRFIIANSISILALSSLSFTASAADTGTFYGDFRLRFESVEQENAREDAEALTLRSRLGYKSPVASGFSGVIEIEDSRALVDDYSGPGFTSFNNNNRYSVVADPEDHTELDQLFVKYKGAVTAKLGRQVITLDNHRFVGHVGWRQDRQTFDALSVDFPVSEDIKFKYVYIDKRNRIFADEADLDAKDHLLNATFKAGPGKLTAYAYLLEVDNNTDNALDTYGIRYSGKVDKFLFTGEFATQEATSGMAEADADYLFLEGGYKFPGVTAKVGYEQLGSDSGSFGFSTPLATLHKFNGWADQFLGTPGQGLIDFYALATGKVAGGKWLVAYHTYTSDEELSNETVTGADDLGDEINLLYAKKFAKRYNAGIKYAAYSAGSSAFGKVDTDKLWIWVGAKF